MLEGDTQEYLGLSMSELGLSADADGVETSGQDGTEAATEIKEDEGSESQELEGNATEGEATEESPDGDNTATEVVAEEPKLTRKEFLEIEQARTSFEAEKTAWMQEMESKKQEFETQYEEKIKTHDELDSFLAEIASTEPDLFEEIKAKFQNHQKQYSNPVIDKLRKEQEAMKKELGTFKARASDEVVINKLTSEMKELQGTVIKEAEAYGLKIDPKTIEDLWADSKLPPRQAFFAVYGEQMLKAQASKAKVSHVEKKLASAPKVSTAGSVKKSNSAPAKDYGRMSVDDILKEEAFKVAGFKR